MSRREGMFRDEMVCSDKGGTSSVMKVPEERKDGDRERGLTRYLLEELAIGIRGEMMMCQGV